MAPISLRPRRASRPSRTLLALVCAALLAPARRAPRAGGFPASAGRPVAEPADEAPPGPARLAGGSDRPLSRPAPGPDARRLHLPLEIIQLQQWLAKHPDLKDKALADAVAKQPWDPAIQSMAAVPDVVKRLADDIQWTTELGNAFLAQQSDVMDAVQRMRKKAEEKGALKSNEQQKVETKVVEEKTVIVVQPTNPEVIYVPSYNPTVVYAAAGLSLSAGLLPPLPPGRRARLLRRRHGDGRGDLGRLLLRLRLGRRNNVNINVNNNINFNRNTTSTAAAAAGTETGSTTPSTAAGLPTRTRRRRASTAASRPATARRARGGSARDGARRSASDGRRAAAPGSARRQRGVEDAERQREPRRCGGVRRAASARRPVGSQSISSGGGSKRRLQRRLRRLQRQQRPGEQLPRLLEHELRGGRRLEGRRRRTAEEEVSVMKHWLGSGMVCVLLLAPLSTPPASGQTESRAPAAAAQRTFDTPEGRGRRVDRGRRELRRAGPEGRSSARTARTSSSPRTRCRTGTSSRRSRRRPAKRPTSCRREEPEPRDPLGRRRRLAAPDPDRPARRASGTSTPKAGKREVLYRRIGRNELDAIEVCRDFVEAQHEYALDKHDGSSVNQYAQKIISTPGKQDGLAWQQRRRHLGRAPSARGVAEAIAEGYTKKSEPLHGYYFKVLKGQGPAAPLGEMDFVVKGVMIGGFALVAAPSRLPGHRREDLHREPRRRRLREGPRPDDARACSRRWSATTPTRRGAR